MIRRLYMGWMVYHIVSDVSVFWCDRMSE